MLDSPWLLATSGGSTAPGENFNAGDFTGLSFRNGTTAPWTIKATVDLSCGADTVEKLFRNLCLCVGHTHPPGDYREYPAYYVKVHAGPRFLFFDGAGSCLLLGAMIQALAIRLLNEKIELHYSVATDRKLTHVFASWKGCWFVDPDQKTWLPLDQVDDAAVYGYVFQQLGVSANALYAALSSREKQSLFSSMSRAYFNFYEPSALQYMSEPRQSTDELCAMFRQARSESLQSCSIDDSDFPWKDEMRRHAARHHIPRPWFLVQAERPVDFIIPPNGTMTAGLRMEPLPPEADILSSIYLGRVPLTLTAPLQNGCALLDLPEVPWLLTFAPEAETIHINGRPFIPRLSRDNAFRILGTGDLEPVLGMETGGDRFVLNVTAPGNEVRAVLPFNAFAAGSGLMEFMTFAGSNRHIEGRRPA